VTEPAAEPTTKATTEPVEEPALPDGAPLPGDPPHRRLRALFALAIASMLVAGGLLMALGGVVRLVDPVTATPTPAPTVVESQPVVTPGPTAPLFPTPAGPSRTPQGVVAPLLVPGPRGRPPGA
jgi:hypothetical protein